jgi:hypothetical protein
MLLLPSVRIRYKGADPVNPERWKLSQLNTHPYDNFMKYIWPKLIVFGYGDEECWCMDCERRNTAIDDWDAQLLAAWNYKDRHPVKKQWTARMLTGRVFYEFPEGPDWCVYRDKDICLQPNCVRPTHLIPSPRNNTRAKYGSAKLP